MSRELKEVVAEELEWIDEVLAEQGIAPARRPLHAATIFVSDCIEEIKGGTKDHYWDQPWFSAIYKAVESWYVNRYGKARKGSAASAPAGLVLIFQTPFKVTIPLSYTTVEKEGETAWVHFPDKVNADEQVLDWIVSPPNLDRLRPDERSSLEQAVARIAGDIRSLHIALTTADLGASVRRLAEGILSHLENSVESICSLEPSRLSLALWELHLAAEKSLKVFLYQQTGSVSKIHPIADLCRAAEVAGLTPVDPSVLSVLTDWKDANRHRYGEIDPPSIQQAYEVYEGVVAVAVHCARALQREITLRDARILIRKAPWI